MKQAVRNIIVLVLNSEMDVICGRAVSLKVSANRQHACWQHGANVMNSQANIHRYSVAKIITKTSATKAISLTVILYHILLLLCVYYRITCGLLLLCNQLKWLHSDKQYRRTVPLMFKKHHNLIILNTVNTLCVTGVRA